jgi:hypothetical protein
MHDSLRAALALAPAPSGFTVAEFVAKVRALTGTSHADYSIRQAGYDLRKLRGKQLVDKPGRTRRYVRPQVDPLRHADAILVLGGEGFSRYPFGIDRQVDYGVGNDAADVDESGRARR